MAAPQVFDDDFSEDPEMDDDATGREKLRNDQALFEDYKLITARWDDVDKRALSIKAWVGLGSLAAAATSATVPELTGPWLLSVVILVLGMVWFLEAIWKSWQHESGPQIGALEAYFRGKTSNVPLAHQLHSKKIFADATHSADMIERIPFNYKSAFNHLFEPFIIIPYLPLILMFLGLGLALYGRAFSVHVLGAAFCYLSAISLARLGTLVGNRIASNKNKTKWQTIWWGTLAIYLAVVILALLSPFLLPSLWSR